MNGVLVALLGGKSQLGAVQPPTGPVAFPKYPIRYDGLGLEDNGKKVYTSVFPGIALEDPAKVQHWVDLLLSRGYTHVCAEAKHISQNFIPGDITYDLLDDPHGFLRRCGAFFDAGFWVQVNPLPEGLNQSQYNFTADMVRFKKFWSIVGHHPRIHSIDTTELSEYMTGVEIIEFAKIVHAITPNTRLFFHFNTGQWHPDDYPMSQFWKDANAAHPGQVAISVQYTKTGSSSGGFLATAAIVTSETKDLRARGIDVLAGEYAHLHAEASGQKLGQVALDAGANMGFWNGGPGLAVSAPGPGPLPPGGAYIDLKTVKYLHADISGWAVTSQVTSVSLGPPLCIEHTKAGKWPVVDGAEGNPWIFANVGGQWYAGTYEWLKPGQTCKAAATRADIGPLTKKPPLESWAPKDGEIVGLAVSTVARTGTGPLKERSDVVFVVWPSGLEVGRA